MARSGIVMISVDYPEKLVNFGGKKVVEVFRATGPERR